jgi:hypothetical protein
MELSDISISVTSAWIDGQPTPVYWEVRNSSKGELIIPGVRDSDNNLFVHPEDSAYEVIDNEVCLGMMEAGADYPLAEQIATHLTNLGLCKRTSYRTPPEPVAA